MTRFAIFAALLFGAGGVLVAATFVACSAADVAPDLDDAAVPRKDGAPVGLGEGGPSLDSGAGLPISCELYCSLVTRNCTGANEQYGSEPDCLAFCEHLPVGQARNDDGKTAASIACRQYWAGSPARTNPSGSCLAAGPFGGNMCGDRCTAFCDAVLNSCSPRGSVPVYASQPDCASACTGFTLRDAGTDGGGEGPNGPDAGDSLNCRLFYLREATKDPKQCALLRPDASACR